MNHQSLSDRVVSFAHLLRRTGVRIGTGQVQASLLAVSEVGLQRRDDFACALRSSLISRSEDIGVFDEAFAAFWRPSERFPEEAAAMLPKVDVPPPTPSRVSEAMKKPRPNQSAAGRREEDVDLVLTYSATDALRDKDFQHFTAEEVAMARHLLADLRLDIPHVRTRRHRRGRHGRRLDLGSTSRAASRSYGEITRLHYRRPKWKPRPLVVLCDISGSMDTYSRMLLHYIHTVSFGLPRVESFVFGTRLTRITRSLQLRNVDAALDRVANSVSDWAGGTRIGACLSEFNRVWLRRVLTSRGQVLIVSDGCDRGDTALVGTEMGRLKRSCDRLLWLNPLLRFDGYEPRTAGILAALPYVDELRSVHNLTSLEQLADVIRGR